MDFIKNLFYLQRLFLNALMYLSHFQQFKQFSNMGYFFSGFEELVEVLQNEFFSFLISLNLSFFFEYSAIKILESFQASQEFKFQLKWDNILQHLTMLNSICEFLDGCALQSSFRNRLFFPKYMEIILQSSPLLSQSLVYKFFFTN